MLTALRAAARMAWPREFTLAGEDAPPSLARQLGRALHVLVRLRLYSLAVTACFALGFLLFEPVPWKVGACLLALAFHGAYTLRDLRRLPSAGAGPGRFVRALAVTHIVFTVLTVVSGGIESPMVVSYAAVAVLVAVGAGEMRPFLAGLVFPLGVVWALAVGRYTGLLPYLVPQILRPDGPEPPPAALTSLWVAVILTNAMLVGGLIALAIRQALDEAAREAERARRGAVRAEAARRDELVRVSQAVAHELKNPLASVRGLAGLLARRFAPESRESRQVEVMLGELERMGDILGELSTFARPFRHLDLRPTDLRAVGEALLVMCEPTAAARGITLRLTPGPAVTVACDPDRITQLLVNLVHNALDATPEGGEVGLSVEATPGGARLMVRDTGVGLADAVRGRLFTPGATTKRAGAGLGLYLARSIAERHGGRLDLTEAPGGGCLAAVDLPATPPADAVPVPLVPPRAGGAP